jgi:hypothetical protein
VSILKFKFKVHDEEKQNERKKATSFREESVRTEPSFQRWVFIDIPNKIRGTG